MNFIKVRPILNNEYQELVLINADVITRIKRWHGGPGDKGRKERYDIEIDSHHVYVDETDAKRVFDMIGVSL